MPRGGARAGAGRPAKPTLPATPSKDQAQQILNFIGQQANPHPQGCRCLYCRWWTLSTALDLRLRFHVEQALLNRVLGLPPQAVEHTGEVGHTHDGKVHHIFEVEFLGGIEDAT